MIGGYILSDTDLASVKLVLGNEELTLHSTKLVSLLDWLLAQLAISI